MLVGQSQLLDEAALGDTFERASLQWAQLESGRFDVRYAVSDVGPIRLSARTFSLGFMADANLAPGKCVISVLADPRTRARWFGSDFDSTHIGLTRSALHVSADANGSFFGAVVDEAKLQRLFPEAPDTIALLEGIKGSRIVRHPTKANRLRALMGQALFNMGAPFDNPGMKPLVERVYGTMIALLADTVEHVDRHAVEPTKCLNRRLRAVRQCESYMREHVDATLSLLDLSQVSGMRSRSLINAFEAVTGYSPMDYLKRLRLNAVHRKLFRANEAHTRIIDVATEWGFWHMGHFTNDYHTMFGETPSQTLLRARNQAPRSMETMNARDDAPTTAVTAQPAHANGIAMGLPRIAFASEATRTV